MNNRNESPNLILSIGTPHDPWILENVPEEYRKRFTDTKFSYPPNYLPDNDPHADAWASLSQEEREELTEWMRIYYAITANLDDNIGRLVKEIHRLGLEENSILVFTSDHGEMFGAHGRRAKNIFYEEAIRVPMLVRFKGCLESGVKRDCAVNTVDIMPTLLSLMKLPIPEEVEGKDLSRLVAGERGPEEGALLMCTGPTADWGDGQEFLFDLENDPYEMENLAENEKFADIKEQLKRQMYERMNAIGDHFEKNHYYRDRWVENRIIMHTATL